MSLKNRTRGGRVEDAGGDARREGVICPSPCPPLVKLITPSPTFFLIDFPSFQYATRREVKRTLRPPLNSRLSLEVMPELYNMWHGEETMTLRHSVSCFHATRRIGTEERGRRKVMMRCKEKIS